MRILRNSVFFTVLILLAVLALSACAKDQAEPNKVFTVSGANREDQAGLNRIEGIVSEVDYGNPVMTSTVVRFEDGRVKSFNGISHEVFQKGVMNIIAYDDSDYIISVTIVSED